MDSDEEEFFKKHQQKLESGGDNDELTDLPDGKKRGIFGRSVSGAGFGAMLKKRASFNSKTANTSSARAPAGQKMITMNDSDDENLSMSSDDEIDSTRQAALERQETRMIRGDAAARAPPSMRVSTIQKVVEGEDGVDDEPDLWENVKEDELAKRVRELRDPRSAVTATSASAAKPGIENVSSVQSDLVDPLGLGKIDLKTLSLARANAPPALSEEVAAKVDKLVYFQETFNPRVYLAQIHRDSLLQELENGKLKLKKDVASHKEELKKLVKDNFDIFISCKDTIDDIHKRLIEMESDEDGVGTRKLKNSIQDCDEVTQRAFGPLLERQAQVERIRSVQGLLQRFRTLFNLPSDLRAFVKAGEYDKAVSEYIKAKSLRLPVNSGILRRVFEEADKVVMELKETLYAEMADPHAVSGVEQKLKLEHKMKLLLDLEPESDPVWHYLQLEELRIRGLLEGALQEAKAQLETVQHDQRERKLSEARWKELQLESSRDAGSDVDLGLLLGGEHLLEEEAADVAVEEESDVLHARLIRRLTAVIRQQLPAFWKLALNIFAGRFANFSEHGRLGDHPTRTPVPQEDEAIPGHYSKHSLEEVGAMVLSILSSYEVKVLNAFTELEQASRLFSYMRDSVGQVIAALNTLKQRDASPPSAISALENLRLVVTARFVTRVSNITRGAGIELAEQEDWIPAPGVLRGNSPYTISHFPVTFRSTLTGALDHVAPILEDLAEEEGIPVVGEALKGMRESLRNLIYESFLDYNELLERISASLTLPRQVADGSGDISAPLEETAAPVAPADYNGVQVGVEVKSTDQRILMLLSNAGFCRTVVLPHLMRKYQELWNERYDEYQQPEENDEAGRDSSAMMAELEAYLIELETGMGDKYIEIKANHLGQAVIKYFLEDGTSWATAPPVKGLRDSALELMHPLVAVHAEVYSGCRPFIERSINMLAEGLMDALYQVAVQHQDLQQLDVNAFCQLSLELDYFSTVLEPFASEALENTVAQLRELFMQRTMEGLQAYPQDGDGDRPHRRLNRMAGGYEEPAQGDNQPQSVDELKMLADSISADLLPAEIRRTKVNVYCFTGRQESEPGSAMSLSHNMDPLSIPNSPYRQQYAAQPRAGSMPRSLSSAAPAPARSLPQAPNPRGLPGSGRSPVNSQPLARRGRAMTEQQPGMAGGVFRTASQYGGEDLGGRAQGFGGQGGAFVVGRANTQGRPMRANSYRSDEDM